MEDIKGLVKKFKDNYAVYANNESQTRQSLIDVMLENLGWEVRDPNMVRVEPSVETETGKKKADYILYDDRGSPVVVIEAKAPKVNIAKDTKAIFQLLRYGRNLGSVPVGILTDFEEWEVYNTSVDPTKDTLKVRIPDLCMRYTDYVEKWDTLQAYFSREAVLSGKLRVFVTTTKTTLPLDERFLEDLKRYRKLIADSLFRRNDFAHDWDLGECTQRTLDRLLLLRILEDRGYADRTGWLHRIAQADDPGRHLSDTVLALQPTYNSRFFMPHAVDRMDAEPAKLRQVVKELADPDSRYDFSAMPIEIIGKAYEQFLGSVIRTTPKQVRIEPKPEVRKAGGVYYTPKYIVDYIVENTLGPLFEGKSLSQAAKIKILDPACGSGSFLIGAARWLERWYSDRYGRPATHEERSTIVLKHLHGVDIDQNAVEVTQLSLCLWLLENAPVQTVMLHEALLPDLSGNIKDGNSLIGTDFYTGDQYDLFKDEEVQHRVNAFDWDGSKGWPEIMKKKTERRLWFVTFVTHNSRVSDRMVECGVPKKAPLILGPNDQIRVAEKIAEICKRNEIPVVAWNVLRDHVHILIGARNETELNESVHQIKGGSSRAYREATGMGKGGHVWAQKFNRKAITSENDLNNVYNYIKENHLKHAAQDKGLQPLATPGQDKGLQPLAPPEQDKGLKPLVSDELLAFRRKIDPILDSITVSVEEATSIRGGFDAVIGNPPYGYLFSEYEGKYLSNKISIGHVILDAYISFIVQGHNLLKTGGGLGFIIPSSWLGGPSYKGIREYLLKYRIEAIILLPYDIFADAYIDTVLLTTTKTLPQQNHHVIAHEYPKKFHIDNIQLCSLEYIKILQDKWHMNRGFKFVLDSGMLDILNRIRSHNKSVLGDCVSMRRGVLFKKELLSDYKENESCHMYFEGDVYRYNINYEANLWVEFGPKMSERPKEFHWFEGKRIVLRRLVSRQRRLMAGMLDKTVITNKNLYVIKPKGKEAAEYILGMLNSTLFSRFYLSQVSQATKDDFPQVTIADILALPYRKIDFDNTHAKHLHDRIASLVERMLELHKRLPKATGSDKAQLEQLIARTDKEIDSLVYELYGLTDEEIKIIEEAVKK